MITKIRLKEKEKKDLLKLKRKSKSEIIRDRAHAVLLRNNDETLNDIAKTLFRSKEFVKQAILRFNNNELHDLKLTGHNYKLTRINRNNLIEMIKTKSPNELKEFSFKDQFWTTDILRAVIKNKYNIEYKTDKSYYDLFKAAGFSFHKPKTKDFRQDPAKMKEFKGALKKSSKTTKIRLSW